MDKVRLEVFPQLAETLGIEEINEEIISSQETGSDRSIRNLLNQLSLGTKYQRFARAVFDVNTQELTGSMAVFLNGRSLDPVKALETRLKDGDTLTFVPVIQGG